MLILFCKTVEQEKWDTLKASLIIALITEQLWAGSELFLGMCQISFILLLHKEFSSLYFQFSEFLNIEWRNKYFGL